MFALMTDRIVQTNLRLPEHLLVALDSERGDVPRNRWLVRAIQARLEPAVPFDPSWAERRPLCHECGQPIDPNEATILPVGRNGLEDDNELVGVLAHARGCIQEPQKVRQMSGKKAKGKKVKKR